LPRRLLDLFSLLFFWTLDHSLWSCICVCELLFTLFAIVLNEWRIEVVIELSKCFEIWSVNGLWIYYVCEIVWTYVIDKDYSHGTGSCVMTCLWFAKGMNCMCEKMESIVWMHVYVVVDCMLLGEVKTIVLIVWNWWVGISGNDCVKSTVLMLDMYTITGLWSGWIKDWNIEIMDWLEYMWSEWFA